MIKNALKNFFKNLLYLFVPMGIVYLFFLIAFFVAVGSVVDIAGSAFLQAFELVRDSVGESSASVNAFLDYAFGQLKWNGNLIEMIIDAFRTRWLSNTIKGFFETLNVSSEGFSEQFNVIMSEFTVKLRALISGVIALCVIGIVAANFLTRVVVRSQTAKRGFKKFLLAHTAVPLAEAILLIGFGVLFAFIRYYTLIALPLFLLAAVAIALTSSWIIHRDKHLKLKEVVTVKNILMHLAAVGLILLINVAVAAVLFSVNALLAILVMIPFVLYSLNIADVNTDAIVCRMIEEKKKGAPAAEIVAAPAPAVAETEAAVAEEIAAATATEEGAEAGEEAPAEETLRQAEEIAPAEEGKEAPEGAPAEAGKGEPTPSPAPQKAPATAPKGD